jgi:hypothetical protein
MSTEPGTSIDLFSALTTWSCICCDEMGWLFAPVMSCWLRHNWSMKKLYIEAWTLSESRPGVV